MVEEIDNIRTDNTEEMKQDEHDVVETYCAIEEKLVSISEKNKEEATDDNKMGGKAGEVACGRKGFFYGLYLCFKRFFDIVISLLFLIIFSWLYLIIAIVVKCSDGGRVFYSHKRVGKKGKTIHIPKFRSMKKNADKLEDILTPEQLVAYKQEYKLDHDPRITKIGRFLRKTSLDELPNFWSVLKGDMSLVGPRPVMEEEVNEKYGEWKDKLLSVKPGIVGWWTSHGRSNSTYTSGERQKLELYYVDHCNFWLDIWVLLRSFVGVFKRTGAK